MKWTVEYIEKQKFARVTLEGDFTAQEHLAMMEDLLSRKFWRPGMSVLFDNQKANYGSSGFDVMLEASRNHIKNDARVGAGKIAFLMKSVADYGLGRQYEMITEGNVSASLHIFMDEDQALHWLAE